MNKKQTFKIDTPSPEALVVQCSDARFQTAFRQFATEDLGLKNYFPLVVGGGVHALGAKNVLPEQYVTLHGQIKFFVEEIPLKRVVLINHEDCKWYQSHAELSELDPDTKAQADLKTAVRELREEFPGVMVQAFWAALDGDKVSFSEVEK